MAWWPIPWIQRPRSANGCDSRYRAIVVGEQRRGKFAVIAPDERKVAFGPKPQNVHAGNFWRACR